MKKYPRSIFFKIFAVLFVGNMLLYPINRVILKNFFDPLIIIGISSLYNLFSIIYVWRLSKYFSLKTEKLIKIFLIAYAVLSVLTTLMISMTSPFKLIFLFL